jgi:serine/threonine protein kinase
MFNVYDEGQSRQLQREIALLAYVTCDALISFKGAFHNEGSIGVIIEYMDHGSIEYLLDDYVEVSEPVMAAIMYQILWGLGYLHYDNRMHRDIKPGNVLFNTRGEVKLSDFGISRTLDNTTAMSSTSVGSFRYMSPERLLGEGYGASGDIWSVGIMMLQLWTKKYPFGNNIATPIDLLTEVENLRFDRILRPGQRVVPPSMVKVVKAMLHRDPMSRATCMELLEYDWFPRNGISSIIDAQQSVATWVYEQDQMLLHQQHLTPTPNTANSSSSSLSYGLRGEEKFSGLGCTVGSDSTAFSGSMGRAVERQSSSASVDYDDDFEDEFDGESSATMKLDDGKSRYSSDSKYDDGRDRGGVRGGHGGNGMYPGTSRYK